EEKISQLSKDAPAIPRLHVPFYHGWNQCLHGVASTTPTTLFPVPIALAATWDDQLVADVADAIGDEARALANTDTTGKVGLVWRAPVLNLSRDPRWGRIEESFGEDSWLISRMGVAYVRGLQGADPEHLKVAATVKHFALNNNETDRFTSSSNVDERLLMEF